MFDLDFYEGKYFKVGRIYKVKTFVKSGIDCDELPISEGLSVDFKSEEHGDVVVGFVRWDDRRELCVYDDVDFRTVKCLNSKNLKEFKKAVRQARELVYKANGWKYED